MASAIPPTFPPKPKKSGRIPMFWAGGDFKPHLKPWQGHLPLEQAALGPCNNCTPISLSRSQGKPRWVLQQWEHPKLPLTLPSCSCSHQPYFISFIIKTTPKIRACLAQPAGINLVIPLNPLKNPSKVGISRQKTVELSRQAIFPSMIAEIREQGGFSISSTGRFSLGKSQTCCQLCSADKSDFQQEEKNLVWGFRFKLPFLC